MKKINTDFSFGELSPKLDGRVDLPYYTKGCSELRNMYVQPQGVASRIGGTTLEYVYDPADLYGEDGDWDDPEIVLIPVFIDDSYNGLILIVQGKGASKIMVYENVLDGTWSKITNNPVSWGSGLSDVQYAQINKSSGATVIITHPNARPKTITYTANPLGWSFANFSVAASSDNSFDSAGNFPSVCGYFAGRLLLGGTENAPDTLWASKTLVTNNFVLGTNDDDAFKLQITTSDYNRLLWVKGKDAGIITGTTTTETLITGGDNGLTPTSLLQTKISTYGSSHTDPIQIGLSTVFVQRDGRRLREIAYTDSEGALASPDISLLAEHLTESGIKKMTYQLAPFEAIFVLRNDGKLVMLSYDRTTGINAWSMLDHYAEDVLDICTLDDRIYLFTKKTYSNGNVCLCVEKLKEYETDRHIWQEYTGGGLNYFYTSSWSSRWRHHDATFYLSGGYVIGYFTAKHYLETGDKVKLTTNYYEPEGPFGDYLVEKVDDNNICLLDLDGNYLTAVPAAEAGVFVYTKDYLIAADGEKLGEEGNPVAVFDADGKYVGTYQEDSDKEIHLNEPTWKITVGRPFRSHMKTMRIVQEAIGNPVSRISKVYLRLWKSLGCKIGETFENSEEITFREGDLDLGVPELYTGDKEHTLLTGYTHTGYFYVWTDGVFPLNICAMAIDYKSGGQRP